MTEKLHWFDFSFIRADNTDQSVTRASVYLGFKNKLITTGKIDYAKKSAGVADDSVLMAFSYMGEATREEITEDYNA